jgi:DNA-binding HxlR family transcriptional regulator
MTVYPAARSCSKPLLPIYDALDALAGRWRLAVIAALCEGPKRFTTLQHDLPGITAKTLSRELKALEQHNLVARATSEESLVAVEYSLTDYGRQLEPVIAHLYEWGARHRQRHILLSEKTTVAP